MINVSAKFVAAELTPGLENGEYRIPSGSTVLDLLKQCEKQSGATIPEKSYQYMYPMFNSRAVRLETPLTEDGVLHLCRVVMGG